MLQRWHRPAAQRGQAVLGMVVAGGAAPFAFAAMAKLVVDAVHPSQTGIATGLNTVMRTIGGVVGGQIAASILAARTIPGTSVPAESGYSLAFWVGAAGALVGVAAALAARSASVEREALGAVQDGGPAS